MPTILAENLVELGAYANGDVMTSREEAHVEVVSAENVKRSA